MKPKAITGIGIVSALGTGVESTFAALARSGADADEAPISSFDASAYSAERRPAIVEVPDFDPKKLLGDKGLRSLDRLTKLLLVAARLSLHHAGLKKDGAWAALGPESVGVCCSNAYGSLEAITELDRVKVLEDARYINPAKFPNTVSNSASGYVSIWEDLRALNVSVSDGNCGALDAFSCADLSLDTGRAEAILTGGGEAMSEALFLAFDKLGVLARASTPLAKPAAKLGEGAAFFVLETPERAAARGAKVLAQVVGYGTAFLPPSDDVTLLFASSQAVERAVRQALEDARLEAKDVDIVVTGVAGIARFDDEEVAGVRAVLGADAVLTAPKRQFGETLGAGPALGMAAALAWMDGTPVSSLIAGDAPAKVETVLVTSIGYYGNASALVLRRPVA